ncbi:MAG: fimbrillin family protein [Candidatus Cryptobacteroides sp.]
MTHKTNISSGKVAAMTATMVAAALLTASCTIDRRDTSDFEVPLSFSPAMYMQVDGELLGGYPDDRPFAVWAWTADASSDIPDLTDGMELFLENAKAVHSGSDSWKVGDVMWPPRDRKMAVMAASPYGAASSCSLSEGIAFDNVDLLSDAIDLLYCTPQTNLYKMHGDGKVMIPFSHALCQISFRVKNRVDADLGEQIRLKKITLNGAFTSGSFHSLPSPVWTTTGDHSTLTFFEGDSATGNEPQAVGQSLLVIPQDLNTFVTVEYEYCTGAGTDITQHLITCPLQTPLSSGRRYIYTLSIGIDDVKFVSELIEQHFTTEN